MGLMLLLHSSLKYNESRFFYLRHGSVCIVQPGTQLFLNHPVFQSSHQVQPICIMAQSGLDWFFSVLVIRVNSEQGPV